MIGPQLPRIMYKIEVGRFYSGTRWTGVRACRSREDAVASVMRGIRYSDGIPADRLYCVECRPATPSEISEHFAGRIASGLMDAESAIRMAHVYISRAKRAA